MAIGVLGVLGLIVDFGLGAAWAGSDTGWYRPAGPAPAERPALAAAVIGAWEPGLVPPFRASSRSRVSFGPELAVELGRVRLAGSWAWLSDLPASGVRVSGPGDVRLGTVVTAWSPGPFRLELGWGVKLANARDETQLGSDETDAEFGAAFAFSQGPWSATLAAGLGVWGNPLRFANQDDVVLIRGVATYDADFIRVGPALSADLPSDRNPPRVLAGAAGRVGRAWGLSVEAIAGITPATADFRLGVGVGYLSSSAPGRSGP